MKKDPYIVSRRMFICEATTEYLIDLLVGSAYLAKISSSLGMSDSEIGILSSFVSLAGVAMLAALLLTRKTPVKRWVIPLHLADQLAFAALYFIPLLTGRSRAGAWIFASLLLFGQILAQIAKPAKLNWFMSLIPDGERGIFSANKEIVSLVTGMGFTALMSAMIDRMEGEGKLDTAFLLVGITILVLMFLHTLTMAVSREKEIPAAKNTEKGALRRLLRDRRFLLIMGLSLLWSIVNYSVRPFFGAYEIGPLGFSMTFVSVLTIGGSVVRVLASRPMGRFGDRHSFLTMLTLGFAAEGLAFLAAAFASPALAHGGGKILFAVYTALHSAALAGINSGLLNLIFDYVEPASRTGALAVRDAAAGLCGFLATLGASRAVDAIQKNGGLPLPGAAVVTAQQVLSVFAALCCALILVYIYFVRGWLRRSSDTPEA